MHAPLSDHPAAWLGHELACREDWRQSWSDDELAAIREVARHMPGTRVRDSSASDREAAVHLLRAGAAAERMGRIQHSLEHGSGAVWLQGLPADEFSLPQLEWIFWALASLVGTPVSQSAAGERVFHVRDERFGEQDARTRGPNTNKQLSFHTDRCDVIGFLCVMPAASGGENQIVSSVGLFNDIAIQRPDLLETLMSPYLYQRHNVDLNHPSRHIEQPIFAIHEGHFAANLLRVLIERAYAADDTPDMTPRQREALDYLEQLADQPERRLEFRQERGDLVLLNNFVTLHRRSAFRDDPTPHLRRHLLRIWLSVPNSRPLDPRFAGNYGDTTAGALRGGMRGPS